MVFCDEADSCSLGECSFCQWYGVNADFEFEAGAGFGGQEKGEFAEAAFYEAVVVFVAGIHCHGSCGFVLGFGGFLFWWFVVEADDDDRASGGHELCGVYAFLEVCVHVVHLGGVAGVEPLSEGVDVVGVDG